MPDDSTPPSPSSPPSDFWDVDFDAIYRGGELSPGVSMGGVPWDIGGPQPAVVEFEQEGLITGDVLDVGCGLGDNAIFLAGLGYRVTGIDGARGAIEGARDRARAGGVEVEFAVADATGLDAYAGRFDTVVDSALYHCLRPEDRPRYAAALYRAARPGARLNLLCFSELLSRETSAPNGLTEERIREPLTGAGWTVTATRRHTIAARAPRQCAGGPVPPEIAAAVDDEGRLRLPAWVAAAHRA